MKYTRFALDRFLKWHYSTTYPYTVTHLFPSVIWRQFIHLISFYISVILTGRNKRKSLNYLGKTNPNLLNLANTKL